MADLGLVIGAIDFDGYDWENIDELFTDAEQAGCSTIWTTDHILSGYPAADPFVLASVALGSTEHCEVGTGVIQLPLRGAHEVAKAAATLQLTSRNRFRLGVGVGQHEEEFQRLGRSFSSRGAATDRALEVLSATGEPVADDSWFAMRPRIEVPIWVGGTSDAALRRTARVASGWLGLFVSPERFAERCRSLDRELTVLGRQPHSVSRSVIVLMSPTDRGWTADDAHAFAARQFPGGLRGIERFVITGDISTCGERIRRYVDAGATEVSILVARRNPVEVLSALQGALGNPT